MVWRTHINRINTISGVSISLHNNFSNLFFTISPRIQKMIETHQIKNVSQNFLIIKLIIQEIKEIFQRFLSPLYFAFES